MPREHNEPKGWRAKSFPPSSRSGNALAKSHTSKERNRRVDTSRAFGHRGEHLRANDGHDAETRPGDARQHHSPLSLRGCLSGDLHPKTIDRRPMRIEGLSTKNQDSCRCPDPLGSALHAVSCLQSARLCTRKSHDLLPRISPSEDPSASERLDKIAHRIAETVVGPASYEVDLHARFPAEAVRP